MKSLVLSLLVLTSCTLSHEAAREVKYGGLVSATGGALTILAPTFNGDGFGTPTTLAGTALLTLGVGLIIDGIVNDPGESLTLKSCQTVVK